jgi:hypothetical protein
VAQHEEKTVAELAAMSYGERYAYFLNRPLVGADEADAEFLAHHRAESVVTIAKRDEEQAAKRGACRAS